MKKTILLGFVAIFAFVSCDDNSSEPVKSTTGTLKVSLIDAPAAYDAVNIVIDSVQAHISNAADEKSGWYTLNNTRASYNLLTLTNGASTVIGSAVLSVGTYSQIRLVLGTGCSVTVDGVVQPLVVSSNEIKLNVHASIEPDMTYELILDFDANKSIRLSGNNTYRLSPVIRTVATATTGIISGTVSPALTRPTIWAIAVSDSFSTVADTSGFFKLTYLDPGTYSVRILPKDPTAYFDTLLTGKTVQAGATTPLNTITLRHK
jgi:hypothetical protein